MEVKNVSKPAIFLDRDGVLIEDFGYVHRIEDVKLFPDVAEGLKALRAEGFRLLVVTNQSGVARGYFEIDAVHRCHDEIDRQLQAHDVTIDSYFICPHHPKGNTAPWNVTCSCRKPKPGLLEQANKEFGTVMDKSFIIGDKASDIECGRAAGIRGIQIDRGQYPKDEKAFGLVTSFAEAVEIILTAT
ncbi:D-glycero-alpha-D-manno-heptose-1,7-bisphosphate 7-phosphatase [Pseudobacteriovorax antillogorgiicola]|nr:HAD family hydrolase [Pseudobacteriovorax antillogorgiicola]